MSSHLNLIDTEKIIFNFEHIQDGWNEYIYRSKFCRKTVRFTEEEQTNYVADLLNYFDDTIHLLTQFKINDNYRSALYDNIAVLQIMYIQQDLISELFQIFKVNQDEKDNTIRFLRNELIGHPISRNKKRELLSSVFITRRTQGTSLEYIRYHKNNGYKFDLKSYEWPQLFAIHEKYLLEHFSMLLNKIDEILLSFKRALIDLQNQIGNSLTTDLVKAVESIHEQYHQNCHPYSADNILYNISKTETHPRYELTNNIYIDGLKESVEFYCHSIDDFLQRQFVREVDKPPVTRPKIEIIYTDDIDETKDNSDFKVKVVKPSKPAPNNSYYYAFSKIHNPDHPFGLSYFKREFSNDKEVMMELDNMNIINSAEFHISYEYLRQLLLGRGILT